MVDLTKFSKEDLKKTAAEINTYLKKTDETEFDPNETTPKAAHLEDKLNGSTKKIEDSTEKSAKTVSKDFPNNESEQMTEPSQGDVMSQILQLLQEIKGMINKPAEPAMPEPAMPAAPTDQIQHAETPAVPAATPSTGTSTSTTDGKKGDININVTKSQVEEILKGMGLAPSTATPKPKQETGHPIEKAGDLTLAKIGKMSWDELNDYDARINPGPYY